VTQVTTSDRRYTLFLAEDLPTEVYPFAPEVSRTAELDQLVKDYLAAKLALFAAVSPTRGFADRRLDYAGTTVVSETTSENATLYPTGSDPQPV
jgi:hypothetical protein